MRTLHTIKLCLFRATFFYPLALLVLAVFCFLFVDYPFVEGYTPYAKSYRKLFQMISLLISPPIHLIFWSLAFLWSRFLSRVKKLAFPLFEIVVVQCLTIAVVRLSKLMIGRARPDSLLRKDLPLFDFFNSNHHFHSFPSGHIMTAFALATSLASIYPKKGFYFILGAFLLACSRVFLLNHFPSDLFATACFGMMIAQMTHYIFHNFITESQINEKIFNSRSH